MVKERYERPVVIKHQGGLANKFGRSHHMKTIAEIDGIAVKEIVRQFGSPVFVFSEKTIRRNYRNAYRSFTIRYPKVQFAWSYKTNYLDAVCKIFHEEGSWAEVVSEYEYEMAKRNGVPGHKIIYNGPYKPYASLKKAILEGACVHVDHYDELLLVQQIAEEEKKSVAVGLRLNMDTGIYPRWDRFGFNYDNGEAMEAARRLFAGGKVKLKGLHAHIGTCILEPAAYRVELEKLLAFARAVETELNFRIEYIDLGGGFASNSTLHEQYAPGDETNPTMDSYADAVTSHLLSGRFSPENLPTLIFETGRALIDNAGYLITSVVANKRLPSGIRAFVIDAGVNALPTSFWYKHSVYPVEEKSGIFEETIMYGPLCMNIDVVRPSVKLPAIDIGDQLVLTPVGAYNVTQWMQFIRMRPAVVLVGEQGEIGKIREPEEIETLKNLEKVPAWLKRK
jgi:diaminopimelate decarboxylase